MKMNLPFPEDLKSVLQALVSGAQTVLGSRFLGAYLQGSFALGDWDADSDVDFIIAIEQDVPEADLPALQALHSRLYDLEPPWAKHLEGSYVPKEILRRAGSVRIPLLFLDNTSRVLERSEHDDTLVVRWVTREHGITLAGPPPETLIDPVPADDLRQEMRANIHAWTQQFLSDRQQGTNRWWDNRWGQPFLVLLYCRALYTIHNGRVGSKLAGARWAQSTLDPRFAGLIQRAWEDRPNPSWKVRQPVDPGELDLSFEFIQYGLAWVKGQP